MASDTSSALYHGNRLVIFVAVYVPIQVFCVGLRYLSRSLVKSPWGLDDALILISLASQTCMAGISIGSVKHAGVGYHVSYLQATDPEKLVVWGKYLVAIGTLYWGSVNIPKLAILALYRRLFPIKENRLSIYVLIGILVGLTISTVTAELVACVPFAANWNQDTPGAHCINKEAFFRYGSLPNVITDIVILVLPLRVVSHLQLTSRLKVGLIVTFVTGSIGLVTSIIRFVMFFRNSAISDGTWSAVDLQTWTQIEPGVYLISACLMTYRPLLESINRRWFVKTFLGGSNRIGNSSLPSDVKGDTRRIPLRSRSGSDVEGFNRLGGGKVSGPGILVQTDVKISKEPREGDEESLAQSDWW